MRRRHLTNKDENNRKNDYEFYHVNIKKQWIRIWYRSNNANNKYNNFILKFLINSNNDNESNSINYNNEVVI